MCDVAVIGGGVVGLSVAYELAGQGLSVRVLEQGQLGREASWAGAGMLPPGNLDWATTDEARLRAASAKLWPQWTAQLREVTGIETGYHVCGSVELRSPFDAPGVPPLTEELHHWQAEHVAVEPLTTTALRERFPAISPEATTGYWLPEFAQVRNPWLLQALQAACLSRGVELFPGHPVTSLICNGCRVHTARTPAGDFSAGSFVIATGAWSRELVRQTGFELPIEPVRGQIVLLESRPLPFTSILQVGHRYIVPRRDGRILIGSTEERVGFDKRTTAGAVAELIAFAQAIVPTLEHARFEKAWAGLRPHLPSETPFIGRVPTLDNILAAAGHYRAGLQLSPITAVRIRELILGTSAD